MFPVSEEFLTAINANSRRYTWTGTITTKGNRTYDFTAKDIVKGSGYIKRQCCGNSEIELGTVYAAEMGITLLSDIDRYTLDGAEVKLFFHLSLPSGKEEQVPMGVYDITEANRNIKTLELKAYDHMLRFDKALRLEASSGSPYQFLKTACDACNVEMAQKAADIAALPNGKMTVGIYEDNDIETYRDLIYYVAQVLGCFCQIDREGRLLVQQYGSEPNWTVAQEHRYQSSYSDFVTRYTAISSTNLVSNISEYIAEETDDALTMNLGVNPLLQLGLKNTREKALRAILDALQAVNYVPFDSTTIGNPAMDPGDIIRLTGGHADDKQISCITSIEYKINGKMTIKCVGKNPRLSSVKSKNDKNIAGLLSSVESGKQVVYNFMNVAPFEIGQSLTKVMDIDFTATEETSAAFHCEMLLEVLPPEEGTPEMLPEMTIVYKINNDDVDNFMPTKTCIIGKHIVTLFFPLSKVVENSANTFSMWLMISGGKITIGEAQIRATISGQGLAAGLGEWNGRIDIEEYISGDIPVGESSYSIDAFKDTVTAVFPPLERPSMVQSIGDIAIGSHSISIDGFGERLWIAEIVRTYTLDSTRGRPVYSDYVTIDGDGVFILRKIYALRSEPIETDTGFLERLVLEMPVLENTESVDISGEELPTAFKLLVQDIDGTVYTMAEEMLVPLEEKELTAELFKTKGFAKMPDWQLLKDLDTPSVLSWCEDTAYPVTATIKGTPPPQYVESTADLSSETVLGIAALNADYSGDVKVQYSYNGEQYSEQEPITDFLATDLDTLYAGLAESKTITFRFWLTDDATLTSFTITYKNEGEENE